jgi:hypothetical protein
MHSKQTILGAGGAIGIELAKIWTYSRPVIIKREMFDNLPYTEINLSLAAIFQTSTSLLSSITFAS